MAVDATTSLTTVTVADSGAPLLTIAELAVWARQEIAADNAFALSVIDAVSLKVRRVTKQPTWDASTVDPEAKYVAIQLAKRTFLNPDAVVAEGGIGPIGGDRYVEDFARTLEFTPAELETLSGLTPAGSGPSGGNGLWIQPTTRGPLEAGDVDVYLFDDSGSDWAIPMYRDIGSQTP